MAEVGAPVPTRPRMEFFGGPLDGHKMDVGESDEYFVPAPAPRTIQSRSEVDSAMSIKVTIRVHRYVRQMRVKKTTQAYGMVYMGEQDK